MEHPTFEVKKHPDYTGLQTRDREPVLSSRELTQRSKRNQDEPIDSRSSRVSQDRGERCTSLFISSFRGWPAGGELQIARLDGLAIVFLGAASGLVEELVDFAIEGFVKSPQTRSGR